MIITGRISWHDYCNLTDTGLDRWDIRDGYPSQSVISLSIETPVISLKNRGAELGSPLFDRLLAQLSREIMRFHVKQR